MSTFQALYRKWRPARFSDVVGQEHITDTLKNEIIHKRIAHAYLFCGTRGTGKTTVAKIFSRAVNCVAPKAEGLPPDGDPCNECDICKAILGNTTLDVMELDAASNNGVDNIRDIREEAVYPPTIARYRVYIIDEAHMLSTSAFNALLKTLEDPPPHAIFILATTETQKIPVTVRSRCQRFDFKRISVGDIAARLTKICDAEGIDYTDEALRKIAALSDGALRDALSLIDQCRSVSGKISIDEVNQACGETDSDTLFPLVSSILEENPAAVLEQVGQILDSGKDISILVESLLLHCRKLLAVLIGAKYTEGTPQEDEDLARYKTQAAQIPTERILYIINELSALFSILIRARSPRVILECGLVKLCDSRFSTVPETLVERLERLESLVKPKNATPVEKSVDYSQEIMTSSEIPFDIAKKTNLSRKTDVEKNLEFKPKTNVTEILQNDNINITTDYVESVSARPIAIKNIDAVALLALLKDSDKPFKPCLSGADAHTDGDTLIITQPRAAFRGNLQKCVDDIEGIVGVKVKIVGGDAANAKAPKPTPLASNAPVESKPQTDPFNDFLSKAGNLVEFE